MGTKNNLYKHKCELLIMGSVLLIIFYVENENN